MEKYIEFVMLGFFLDLYDNGDIHIDWDNIDTDAMYARMEELQDEFLEPYVIDNGVTA